MGKHGVLKDRVAAFPCEDVFENDSPHFIDPEDHAVDAVRYKRTTARQRGRLVILR